MNPYQLSWAGIILYCILMYIILDGFTLGTGMLLPLLSKDDSDIAMSVVLPTWDGNQTWLVLGLASLYGAFPLAFALLMPALYLPLLIMGIFLLFRGVSFEFRMKSPKHKSMWDVLFAISSYACTIIQGLVLGVFIKGFDINSTKTQLMGVHYFSYFSVFTAVSLVLGYMLLGSTRLILKIEGDMRKLMYRLAPVLGVAVALCLLIVSIWTPFINPLIEKRWFDLSAWPYLVPMPAIMVGAFLLLQMALMKKMDHFPYWAAVIMFLCPYAGFAASVYPYIIPYHLLYWQAASGVSSLRFTLIGACVMLPILTSYTYYSYTVFKGKVKDVIQY